MFCTHCGKEMCDEAYVCTNCGCLLQGDFVVERQEGVNESTQEEQPQTNGIAVAGFICSFFIPLLGWIFGGIGLARANKRNGVGKGFSIAAIAIASAGFVLGVLSPFIGMLFY